MTRFILIQALLYFERALQILIFIRILMSWFGPRVYSRETRWFFQLQDLVFRLTEPVLAPIRNLLPMSNFGIDFSPIVAAFLLDLVTRLLVSLVASLPL